MRIFNADNIELTSPDLSRGYLKDDRIFVKHHPAVEHVEERWHYEVVTEYPNGGKDVKKVVDVVGTEAMDAWDEYEDILRYVEYTDDELQVIKRDESIPTFEDRLKIIETIIHELVARDKQ